MLISVLHTCLEEFDPFQVAGQSATFDSSTAGGSEAHNGGGEQQQGHQQPNENPSEDRANVIVTSDTNFPVDVVIALIVSVPHPQKFKSK